MKQTMQLLVIISLLVAMQALPITWMGRSAAIAQEAGLVPVFHFDVTIVTAEGAEIVVPIQLDQEAFAALMNLAPTAAVMDAMTQIVDQRTLTITVVAPSIIEPITAEVRLEPESASAAGRDGELLVEAPTDFTPSPVIAPPLEIDAILIRGASEVLTESLVVDESVEGVDESVEADVEVETDEPVEVADDATTAADSRLSVTNANAYQRTGSSIDAAILGQLPEGAEVTIIGRNSDGEWLYLEGGSWIASFLIDRVPESLPMVVEGAISAAEMIPATVTGDTVILRNGPSQANASAGMYVKDTVTAVLNRSDDGEWLEVVTPDGRIGWMAAALLDVGEGVEAVPVIVSNDDTSIYGKVLDGASEGVNGVVIAAIQVDDGLVHRLESTTQADGSFLIDVPRGSTTEWTVVIADVDCDSRLMNNRCQMFGYFAAVPQINIELPLSEPVELLYKDATSIIAGTVFDADGQPSGKGTEVSAERADGAITSGVTSSSGKFVLPADAGVWAVVSETGPATKVQVEEGSAPDPIEVYSE